MLWLCFHAIVHRLHLVSVAGQSGVFNRISQSHTPVHTNEVIVIKISLLAAKYRNASRIPFPHFF
jgi:hypothetical protein